MPEGTLIVRPATSDLERTSSLLASIVRSRDRVVIGEPNAVLPPGQPAEMSTDFSDSFTDAREGNRQRALLVGFAAQVEKADGPGHVCASDQERRRRDAEGGTTIQCVEDSAESRYLVECMLRNAGYAFISASNGVEALQQLEQSHVDLIVSDVLMPQMDGFQLCREVKRREALRDIPFVFYTATYTEQKDQDFGLSLGAARFVNKPQEPEAFIAILRSVIAQELQQGSHPPAAAPEEEEAFLATYNQRLVHKLEAKVEELRALSLRLQTALEEKEREAAERKQSEEALRQSEQFTEETPHPVMRVSPDGSLLYGNAPALRLLEEMGWRQGGPLPELLLEPVRRAPRQGALEREVLGPSSKVYLFTLSRVGGAEHVNLFGLDITERKWMENSLREAERRKGQFLGVLSHELRNPLTPIRNALHILRHVPESGEHARRARAVIERQTDHLARLIDDLLDVTRISQGKIRLRRSPVELTALVGQIVEDERPAFTLRNIALSLDLAGGPHWIDADPTRITQSLGNILNNAAKFTSPLGHVAVSVRRSEPSRVEIRVADDGIGIAPEMQPHIFEPFTQVDDSLHRGFGGLGLGLALVKGIIEMHGGHVEVRSQGLGRGSEFTISLPTVLEVAVPPRPPALAASAPARPLRVLAIEDNVDAVETLKVGLEMSGYDVATACDGDEGLAKARALAPDVVLCDIGLPGLDGYEVARRIRADPTLAPLLIALTGYAQPEDQRAAFKAGFDYHLAKPFAFDELQRILAKAPIHPRRILVVDDNDELRSNIKEVLESEGWEVREARNGAEAVEAVGAFRPAVMLLDYRMPEMDGGEVLRRLGVMSAPPRVVLMTASAQVRQLALEHGLSFYVPKPFRSDDLLDTVEHARAGW